MVAARKVAAKLGLALGDPERVDLPGEEASAHLIVRARMRRL
jgi:hypothetical protein